MAKEPVERVSTFILALLPGRMMEPSPNCFVIEDSASSMFFSRACTAGAGAAVFVSEAFVGVALDMAEMGTLVDALIWDRRDSKIQIRARFFPGGRAGGAGVCSSPAA